MPSSLFITSPDDAKTAGVYAIELAPPASITGVSGGYVGLVAQFAWGPENVVLTPTVPADLYDTLEPAGSPRSSTGYRAIMRRTKLPLKIVRVVGSGAAKAVIARTAGATGGGVNAQAKYKGALGNSITIAQQAAASGTTARRDFVVTLTDAVTGTTTETYADIALPGGIGGVTTVDVTASKLLGSFTVAATDGSTTMTAWPTNFSANLATGADGTASSSDYLGTPGTANAGLALFEAEPLVRAVCVDDCGSTARVAANAGLAAHATAMGDRLAVCQFDVSASLAANPTALVSDSVITLGAWVQVRDDGGTLRTSPLATCVAAAICGLDPQESHAWWDDKATAYYACVEGIVAPFSPSVPAIRAQASALHVALPLLLPNGRYGVHEDFTASADSAKWFATRRRITNYLAISLVAGLLSFTNGPLTADSNRTIKMLVHAFLTAEIGRGRIVAFSLDDSMNTPTTAAAGDYSLAIAVQTPGVRRRTFLLMLVGANVIVKETV